MIDGKCKFCGDKEVKEAYSEDVDNSFLDGINAASKWLYDQGYEDLAGRIAEELIGDQEPKEDDEDLFSDSESEVSKHADAGYMNDMRFGESPDF